MLPIARVVVVVLVVLSARSATSATLALPKLGVEIEAAPGWRLGPEDRVFDTVLLNEGDASISMFATPGTACAPAAEAHRPCPSGFTCFPTRVNDQDLVAYCAAVPGGSFQALRPGFMLESSEFGATLDLVLTRTRDAVAKLRKVRPWGRRAAASGLELAIDGDASWELDVLQDFRYFTGSPERVDTLTRKWPAPRIEVQFLVRGPAHDCETMRRALTEQMKYAEVEHADWPREVSWVLQLVLQKADGTGELRSEMACARTRDHTVMWMAHTDGKDGYLEVVRAVLAVVDGGAGAGSEVDAASRYHGEATVKALQMGRFYLQGFGLRSDGADDRYGGRLGMELWVDLNEERALSPMFGFGLSGSANSKLQLGFDTRIAAGGGINVGAIGFGVLATVGVDRVNPADGVVPYAGVEAFLSLTIGRALLDVVAQWNTSENRAFLQFGLPSGLAFGAEWIRYRDAMPPSDMLGVFFGFAAPRS